MKVDELIKTLEEELERHKAYRDAQRDIYSKHSWRGFCSGFEEALDIIREAVGADADDEPGDIDSDLGYDPYLGCFTDDC